MRRISTAVAVLFAAGACAASALAGGNGATSMTFHQNHDSFTLVDVCAPPPAPGAPVQGYIVTFDGNEVFHVTVNKAGDFWVTGTVTGQATFDPVTGMLDDNGNLVDTSPDATRPAAAGHLTTWFGASGNKQNYVFHDTGTFHGVTLTQPSQAVDIHFVDHTSSTAPNSLEN